MLYLKLGMSSLVGPLLQVGPSFSSFYKSLPSTLASVPTFLFPSMEKMFHRGESGLIYIKNPYGVYVILIN